MNTHWCAYCGVEVGPEDYDGIGASRVYLCASPKCEGDFREDQRGAEEHAMLDAIDDGFGRYL